jgi:hypothetical protein
MTVLRYSPWKGDRPLVRASLIVLLACVLAACSGDVDQLIVYDIRGDASGSVSAKPERTDADIDRVLIEPAGSGFTITIKMVAPFNGRELRFDLFLWEQGKPRRRVGVRRNVRRITSAAVSDERGHRPFAPHGVVRPNTTTFTVPDVPSSLKWSLYVEADDVDGVEARDGLGAFPQLQSSPLYPLPK